MKLLPHSRAGWIRCTLILSLFAAVFIGRRFDRVATYYLSDKAEGDILFQSLPHMDLVDAIEGISGSEWSHCGILVKKDGAWQVAEAIDGVRYTPLYFWLIRGRGSKVAAYRVNELPTDAAARIKAGVKPLLGCPYDFRYAPDDDAIYCSELVYKVYGRQLSIHIGDWERLGELNWKPYESFIRHMENGGLPLDRAMITPVALTRSPLVTRVFPR